MARSQWMDEYCRRVIQYSRAEDDAPGQAASVTVHTCYALSHCTVTSHMATDAAKKRPRPDNDHACAMRGLPGRGSCARAGGVQALTLTYSITTYMSVGVSMTS